MVWTTRALDVRSSTIVTQEKVQAAIAGISEDAWNGDPVLAVQAGGVRR